MTVTKSTQQRKRDQNQSNSVLAGLATQAILFGFLYENKIIDLAAQAKLIIMQQEYNWTDLTQLCWK